MFRFVKILLVFSSLWLAACAGNPMLTSADQTLTAPDPNKAQVVFMRSSFVGSAINASLFEVTGEGNEFIGIMANGTKISHEVEPGEHTFMVVSEAADFMRADLQAGKTYYAMVTPRMGAWKARFSFQPLSKDGEDEFSTSSPKFGDWVAGTKLVENTPQSLQWAENNAASVSKKKEAYYTKWQAKDADEQARQSLKASDGI
ncbi:hypothetical protein PVT68_10830 [Microbulbifer bruguierae]|uniref:DUF2846 domain-containing protein n=1 Tax=Microbulbifer bruguierae TaxID=3029061 RepID=A0ABY8N9E3_9GAMM|nr:hypothetical protein [Microbulbifer bruguierae]WGL15265.1 hypothetical protein PVT68_10830 [Microbulbifer bruguierae]